MYCRTIVIAMYILPDMLRARIDQLSTAKKIIHFFRALLLFAKHGKYWVSQLGF